MLNNRLVVTENEIALLKDIVYQAADEIMRVYNSEIIVASKDDKSPLTQADMASNEVIKNGLTKYFNTIPILSEEMKQQPFSERCAWSEFWCVDPLDGTKEFINKNGEFTINIALIQDGYPVFGIIYLPVLQQGYFGSKELGAYKYTYNGESIPIHCPEVTLGTAIHVVGSRSHLDSNTMDYVNYLKTMFSSVDMVSKGSSLKFCMVAEGLAACYPRFGPTMEWDTAAGQIIAESAGASVFNAETLARMNYNKENLLNPSFIVFAKGIPLSNQPL